MAVPAAPDHRRLIADRNVAAILDAAESLLEQRAAASIAAVAAAAGVSRVTVYAHFATWEALLAVVVERAAQRSTDALKAADPDHGPPLAALDRVLVAGWRELARNSAIAQAAAQHLSPTALAAAHHAIHHQLCDLVKRGRVDGSFRADLPAAWLMTSALALIHACAEEVRSGRMDEPSALHVLTVTVRDLFTGTGTDQLAIPTAASGKATARRKGARRTTNPGDSPVPSKDDRRRQTRSTRNDQPKPGR